MTESSVKLHKGGGVTFSGPDAIELVRAVTLRSALRLLKVGITPTRGLTSTKAFAMCERYTGKKYKRGRHDEAMQDLEVWIQTMKAALPVVEEK